MEAIADRLGISRDKMFVNLDRYGNTSAAAVAIALDEANRSGRIKAGDYVVMVVFGSGLTWAGSVVEWWLYCRFRKPDCAKLASSFSFRFPVPGLRAVDRHSRAPPL